ncbi:hypothetical protein RKD37_000866 [Streptomyces ambofaciens]
MSGGRTAMVAATNQGRTAVPMVRSAMAARYDEQVPVEQADEKIDAHPGVVGLLTRHVGYSGVEFVPQHLRVESVAVIAVLLEPSDRIAEPRWGDLSIVQGVAVQLLVEQREPGIALADVRSQVAADDRVGAEGGEHGLVGNGQATCSFLLSQDQSVHAITQQVLAGQMMSTTCVGQPLGPAAIPLEDAVKRCLQSSKNQAEDRRGDQAEDRGLALLGP